MPSKKKNSKTPPSKLDQSSPCNSHVSSPRTPLEPEFNEQVFTRSILEEASIRYPCFISQDAFVGRITDVESSIASNSAKIWLSESAMVSSSLVPGSIVTVSLCSSRNKLSGGFPLDSLIDECHSRYAINFLDKSTNEPGSYFALAVVYPSSKVLKDGVRLSSSLASTMGNPSLGKITFVFPIRNHAAVGFLSGNNMLHHPAIIPESHISICNCRDLYLELVLPEKGEVLNAGSAISESHHDQPLNGKVSSSPKTPFSNKSPCQALVSKVHCSNEAIYNTSDIEEALGNEKSRELLQTCASLWVQTRFLLRGNLVVIPMCGKTCVFLVQGAEQVSTECPIKESENEGKCVLSSNAQTVSQNHLDVAFFVDNQTKVHFNSSVPLVNHISDARGLLPSEPDCRDIKDKMSSQVLKLGGLSKELAILKDTIIFSLAKGPLSSLGLRPTKGVLLHGPPGTGKTSLIRACVNDAGINLFSIKGPEIIGQFHGESEQTLKEIFESANKAPPAVVFIDELDAIAPARKDGGDELSQRMVATLLNLMDGISQTDGILVIAATNRPESIDPALRRPGRLDREIEIGVPSPLQRLDIIQSLLNGMDHDLMVTQIQHLASNTHGFVGADLALLCNEAALVCLRRQIRLNNFHSSSSVTPHILQSKETFIRGNEVDPTECSDVTSVYRQNVAESVSSSLSDLTVSSEIDQLLHSDPEKQQTVDGPQKAGHSVIDRVAFELEKEASPKIGFDDFEKAKMKVRPSAMREVILEIPKVRWEDVGGQNEVKEQLMEAVEWPQKHHHAFERIGTRPPTGILLFGPPGCSKTLMARAVASEAGLNFFSVKGPELFSKWVGESEKAVKSLFAKARANAPSIIFFDEIDGLAIIRGKENDGVSVSDRVMSQLLVELDGLHQRVDVTVIAATNRPDKIDPALLRPGRFDRLLYVGPPNEADREDIFRIHVREMPCSSNVNIRDLAHHTEGCTGADISLICREAAFSAMEESLDASEVSMEHFKVALGRVQPSEVGCYQNFSTKFQRLVSSGATIDDTDTKSSPTVPTRFGIRTLLKLLVSMLFRLPAFFVPWRSSSQEDG